MNNNCEESNTIKKITTRGLIQMPVTEEKTAAEQQKGEGKCQQMAKET